MIDLDIDDEEKKLVTLEFGFKDIVKMSAFPWEWEDASIDEIKLVDIFSFIKAKDRPIFMDELYRILVVGGKASIIVPYYSTALAFSDYAAEWPPICEQSFLYFNKAWRKANELNRPVKADFDFTYGYVLAPEVATRAQEVQSNQVKNYWNTVQRLQVNMIKTEEV